MFHKNTKPKCKGQFIKLISLLFQYKQDPSNSSIENDAAWCRFDSGEYSEHGFYITFFFSSYAIPMILIIFLYIAMLRRLWNPGSIGKQISKESLRNKKRVTRYFFHFHCFSRLQFSFLEAVGGWCLHGVSIEFITNLWISCFQRLACNPKYVLGLGVLAKHA